MSEPKHSPRGRKLVIRSAIVGFFVISGWIVTLIVWQARGSKTYDFRAETHTILKRIADGQARRVYERSSPSFQKRVTREYFVGLAQKITRTLGPIEKIIGTVPGAMTTSKLGKTGHTRARIRFRHGSTTGNFSYHHSDGEWRLLGFDIEIPDQLQHKATKHSGTSTLSQSMHDLVVSIFQNIRDGNSEQVYNNAAEPFRAAVDSERFAAIVALHSKRLGKLEHVVDVTLVYQDRWKTYAEVNATLKYKKRKRNTKAMLKLINIQNQWKLLAYHVSVSGR